MDRTNADKKSALEAIGIYDLQPGQWIELEWPPAAHLWDPGNVYTTEFELRSPDWGGRLRAAIKRR
ncbi:MAG: hypothetical protein ABWY20_22000 [Mycobacterium sp.]